MGIFRIVQDVLAGWDMPLVLILGAVTIAGLMGARAVKRLQLPSVLGYMLIGLLLGPSLVNLLHERAVSALSFIPQIALGFVAFSIGIELSFRALRQQGVAIILIIIAESFGAFIVVGVGLYLLTRDLPLALVFGAMAPASAPAGTVAVIREYGARGKLTQALYAVVGFDDGLAVIIFGFAAAVAKVIITQETGGGEMSVAALVLTPLRELGLSVGVGVVGALLYSVLARALSGRHELLVLTFSFVLILCGICEVFHLSLILTNMVVGLVVVNTQRHELVHQVGDQLGVSLPLLFVLFFALAGASLHLSALAAIGGIGVVYIITRSAGLMGGAYIGAVVGRSEPKIRKYTGMGILAQAGVAIGLSLIVKHDFAGLGPVVETVGDVVTREGDMIGAKVITTIAATSIFFEIIGPIGTRIALTRAGEIPKAKLP